jgi:hypothetical protein
MVSEGSKVVSRESSPMAEHRWPLVCNTAKTW